MAFSRWLRTNSEHYLTVDAHEQLARRYHANSPRPPRSLKDIFWLRVFIPVYRALPWPLRHRLMTAMPGSHRKTWAPPPRRRGPAV
jgi:hypothetical protein